MANLVSERESKLIVASICTLHYFLTHDQFHVTVVCEVHECSGIRSLFELRVIAPVIEVEALYVLRQSLLDVPNRVEAVWKLGFEVCFCKRQEQACLGSS